MLGWLTRFSTRRPPFDSGVRTGVRSPLRRAVLASDAALVRPSSLVRSSTPGRTSVTRRAGLALAGCRSRTTGGMYTVFVARPKVYRRSRYGATLPSFRRKRYGE
jgi:hypothetical protein